MNANRTEKPTKQKLKKAKEKGQVAKSTFLAGAIVFAGGVLLLWGAGSFLSAGFQASMRGAFFRLKEPTLEGAFWRVGEPLFLPLVGVLCGIFASALFAHLFQTGWIFSAEQILPKWRKKKGERRIILPLLQFALIAAAGYLATRTKLDPNLLFSSSFGQSAYILKKMLFLALKISVLLLILGLVDFWYQKWRYNKQMHMTPEEKKQELKDSEGDSSMKNRMRDR